MKNFVIKLSNKKIKFRLGNSLRVAAFTLAEILIVLGIIGLIAEITIPTLIQNTHEMQTVAQVKKSYSILCSAFDSMVADGVDIKSLFPTASNNLPFFNAFIAKLNVNKSCVNTSGCYSDQYYFLNKSGPNSSLNTSSPSAILADGSQIVIRASGGSMGCDPSYGCGLIDFDVNGSKTPNTMGKDMFEFIILPDRIIPFGALNTPSYYNNPYLTDCNIANPNVAYHYGYSCAKWVILKGNMDYLYGAAESIAASGNW